jgi:alanine racemase
VDLGAIRHNTGRLARAAGAAEVCAVVKADGYGHGAVPVARAVLDGGARRLAVATAAELEELRAAGVGAPVLVMGPLWPEELARVVSAGGEPAVWTSEAVRAAATLAAPGTPVPVHLKIDTGMGRLGARPESLAAVVEAAGVPGVRVVGLMTHFATADEAEGENAAFFREQLLRFRALLPDLAARFPDAVAHAANSAAVLREPDAAFGMVRPGIALYGCSPYGDDATAHGLRPALSLRSWLASRKPLRSRESVGYGRTHRASRGTWIGLVPVGYADGYSRALSNRAEVLVGGRRVPVVGNVSMDQITVDLGPESAEVVGDEVVLVGEQDGARVSAEEVAAWQGTIPYEVTTSVGRRVPRRHAG